MDLVAAARLELLQGLLGHLHDGLDRTAERPVRELVQIEHEWISANDKHAERYLGELARITRESGIGVR